MKNYIVPTLIFSMLALTLFGCRTLDGQCGSMTPAGRNSDPLLRSHISSALDDLRLRIANIESSNPELSLGELSQSEADTLLKRLIQAGDFEAAYLVIEHQHLVKTVQIVKEMCKEMNP